MTARDHTAACAAIVSVNCTTSFIPTRTFGSVRLQVDFERKATAIASGCASDFSFAAGNEVLSDYEMIELILFRAQPRGDLKPLAKELLKTFGSFAETISAPVERLKKIKKKKNHRAQAGAGGGQSPGAGRGQAAAGAVIVGLACELEGAEADLAAPRSCILSEVAIFIY